MPAASRTPPAAGGATQAMACLRRRAPSCSSLVSKTLHAAVDGRILFFFYSYECLSQIYH
uniref:Uncharacterized protein n=1 Tax=Oryza brachyantha TaxID=4533 RepID=J3MCC1_ORYBR